MKPSPDSVVMVDDFVPVIDLTSRDSPGGRTAIAEAIGRACEQSGFFTIVGHGVPAELVDLMHVTTSTFFTRSDAEKELAANRAGVSGWRRFGAIGADDKLAPGLYEAFAAHVTGELSDEERAELGDYPAPWKIANIWPTVPGNFKQTWQEYTAAMTELSRDVMRLFALALGADERYFDGKFDNHVSLLLANYYYPQLEPPRAGQLRRGSHTDWGSLTILYQEVDNGGLQVLQGPDEENGVWRDIPAVPGSFVVNIGDMMAFWTGGRWKSTVHRVANPTAGNTASRLSVPFFYMPNHDASIEPVSAGARQFDRTTAGEWLASKMQIKVAEKV